MFHAFVRTLLKVTIASLIVGAVLAHFGVTTDRIMLQVGLSQDRVLELARQGLTWALPHLLLGSLVILPLWFLFYLPSAACAQRLIHAGKARRAARSRSTACRLVSSEAATKPVATMAIRMVQIALVSGFTPRRTSE
jgi:hypothetical protein